MITFFSFLLTAVFWPGIPGMALTPRWALISVLVPVGLLALSPAGLVKSGAAWVGSSLLAYAALSLLWTPSPWDGLFAFMVLSWLAGVAVIGARLDDLKPVYLGMALGIGVSSLLIILEVLGVDVLQVKTQARVGLFFNPNIVTESAVLVMVACLATRQWGASLLCLPAVVLTHARGGLLALGVCALWAAWKRSPLTLVAASAAILALAVGISVFNTRSEDGFRANLSFNPKSVYDRINIWEDTWSELAWLGHGVGSFRVVFPSAPYKGPELVKGRTDHAHNDYLELAFDLGLPGLGLFVWIIFLAFWSPPAPEKMILLAFTTMGLVGFPMWMPVTGVLGALALGRLLR